MSKPPLVRPIIILGGGGHARVVIDALRCAGHVIAGVIDPKSDVAETLPEDVTWLGKDLSAARPGEVQVAIGVGSIDVGARNPRPTLFAEAKAGGFEILSVRHPSAIVAGDVELGEGSQIMAGAILQPGVRLGVNCIVNTGASLDHDCWIGDHVHIAPRAVLSGTVAVGDGSHLGTGAIVIQGIRIGSEAMIAAGAVVTRDVAATARVKPGNTETVQR
ncbi:acetyltransferase [Dongia sedimenti]|uniref:Acetyltransferase n=1 Tax=Dongia sedimenti TaxID=3064282 RepID=A0ABU0YM51_9PROT|nr:acetyltransferase [Rhodospirillaceae bacterium R-7]